MKSKVNIGIDFGGSHIAIGAVKNGMIIEKIEKYFSKDEKKELKKISKKFIIESINNLKEEYELSKIGIGVAGTISNGKIIKSVNLGIENYNIKKVIENATNLSVTVKNDAKCASIAEYKFGNCNKYKKVLFLTLGTGIGGSYIYNGKLMEGSVFEGLEIGHMVINKDGIECRCGKKGCFEKYASLAVLKKQIIKKLKLPDDSNGEFIRSNMEKNLSQIKEIKESYIENLAIGISNLVNIFEPDIIVLGGGFAKYSYLLLEDLEKKIINSNLLFNSRKKIVIKPAMLGNDAGIIGASCY